jgi:hypothetical protein
MAIAMLIINPFRKSGDKTFNKSFIKTASAQTFNKSFIKTATLKTIRSNLFRKSRELWSYSSFKTSLGDNTLTGDSPFNALSPEKIGQFKSTTSIMVYYLSISSYLLAKDSLILSDNSSTFSSVNSLLDTILFNRASRSNLSLINRLTANDQSISETCPNSNFKSSGISTFNSPISITDNEISTSYLNTFVSMWAFPSFLKASQMLLPDERGILMRIGGNTIQRKL